MCVKQREREREREGERKIIIELILQAKKVFACKGGYRTIKKGLRRRGWVELDQPSTALTTEKKERREKEATPTAYDSDDSDDDNGNNESGSENDQSSDEDLSEGYRMLVCILGHGMCYTC